MRRILFRRKLLRRPLLMWRYRESQLTPHDAFLIAYPRSGTTWLRFILFEVLSDSEARFGHIREAVPSIGLHPRAKQVLTSGGRLIQTHEPFPVGNRKVVYVARDPRSVVLSEYAWQKRLGLEPGAFEDFLQDFLRGRSNAWGSWDHHVRFWLNSAPARNGLLHLVRFEELRASTFPTVRGILDFLNANVRDEQIERAIQNNTVARMRSKEDEARAQGWRETLQSEIRFVNEGSVEGWKERLTPDQRRAIEDRFAAGMELLDYRAEV